MADNTTEASANLADAADIVKVWRPLTGAVATRAEGLLEFVSRAVRRQWPDVDARIEAGTLGRDDVADVVVWTVIPILSIDTDVPINAKAYQRTAGSKSVQVTLADATGALVDLEFAGWMVDVLGDPKGGSSPWPRSRFRSPAGGRYEAIGFEWNEEPRRRSRDAARD